MLIDEFITEQEITKFNKFLEDSSIKTLLFETACKNNCHKLVNLLKHAVVCDPTKCIKLCCENYTSDDEENNCNEIIRELMNMKADVTIDAIEKIKSQGVLNYIL